MRERRVSHGIIVVAALCLSIGVFGCAERTEELHLTILHTNDTHGHLLPFSYPDPVDTTSTVHDLPAIRDIGGMGRLATLCQQIRQEVPGGCLLLHAGDLMDGTPFSIHYQGRADIEVMNVVGYEALVPGNHEFNMSFEQFGALVETAEFPVLCANARLLEDGEAILPSHTILERGGVRIGIFGITTPASARYPACRGRIEILDPLEASRRTVAELEGAGVDLIVALTHLGLKRDLALADSIPAIDVIVGGHSHTRLAAPRVVRHLDGEGSAGGETIIVQAFQWAGELGRLDLTLSPDREGRLVLVGYEGRLLPITQAVAQDEAVASLIEELYEPMRPIYDVLIGRAAADFANTGFERATVNLVADAMRSATGVDVALQNKGGVRESIFEGPIRLWEIHSMLPFGNRIAVMEISGARLLEALQDERESYGFSGMRVVWEGDRPIRVEVGGVPLEAGRLYTAATNGYILEKCFSDIKGARLTDRLVRDAVIDTIRAAGTVEPVLDGRSRRAG